MAAGEHAACAALLVEHGVTLLHSGRVDAVLDAAALRPRRPPARADPITAGAALFAFLDPFGTALDRAQLCSELLSRPGRAPTELLLHVSVSTVARIGGILRAARRDQRETPWSSTILVSRDREA